MILVDIDIPETCRECPMSCQLNGVNKETQRLELQILCRVDWRQHKPLDRNCPILGRAVSNNTMIIDYILAKECQNHDAIYTCHKCGKCGRKFEDGYMVDDGGTTIQKEYEDEE